MHRRYLWFFAAAVPVTLFTVVAERNSWRPKTLGIGRGAVAPIIAFSPDGRRLVVAYNDNWRVKNQNSWLEVWTYPALQLNRRFSLTVERYQDLAAIAFEPQGNRIATLHSARPTSRVKGEDEPFPQYLIRFWDVSTGRLQDSLTAPPGASGLFDVGLCFWPDKNRLNCCAGDFPFSVSPVTKKWKARKPFRLSGKGSIIWSSTAPRIVFSPDGVTVASMGNNQFPPQHAFLANGRTSEVKRWLPSRSEDNNTWPMAFSPDGTLLVGETGGLAGNTYTYALHLWDVHSGTLLHTFPVPGDGVCSVAFSSDGHLLAGSSLSDTITLWDVASGTPLRTLKSSEQHIQTLAFSPDGSTLVSGGFNGRVTLWRIK